MDAYRLAEEFSEQTNRCLFITGKAGTGKTTFLKRLRERSQKNMAVVAPTGVAAVNAGGMTIHSFFQLPVRTLVPTLQSYRQLFAEQRMQMRKRNLLYHLELLVIDEISMVRADVLDAIDAVLRHYKYKQNEPFGGVQVIMIGDLFQLSPVVKGDDEFALMQHYEGVYFFHSKVMQALQPVYIELDHVFRQKSARFVQLLNEVRENSVSEESMRLLASCYQATPKEEEEEEDFHITLTTHNQPADELNHKKLERLPGKVRRLRAVIRDNFPESAYPTDAELQLKEGARVMFIRNDEQKPRRFYNGKQGVVRAISEEEITVECEEGEIQVGPSVWENIRYREDPVSGAIQEESLGTFTQFPLRLAWAITIHKSQGLTFDKVRIDAARAFAAGQVYVALSRCRSIEGIMLSSPLTEVRLGSDRQVTEYVSAQPSTEQTAGGLRQAQLEYRMQLFGDLFDFRRPDGQAALLLRQVGKAVSFNADSETFLREWQSELQRLIPIGERFQIQLKQLIMADSDRTGERLKAAANYFTPTLRALAISLDHMPCRSKNKSDADDFMRITADLFLTLQQKIHLMQAVAESPCVEGYLAAKGSFTCPPMQLKSILEKAEKAGRKTPKGRTRKTTSSEIGPKDMLSPLQRETERILDAVRSEDEQSTPFPELLKRLRQIDMLNERQRLDILTALPRTPGDLADIHSLSPYLLETCGDDILDIVNVYFQEQHIHSGFVEIVRRAAKNPKNTPQAGRKWTQEEDKNLEKLYRQGDSVSRLADLFARSYGAIDARLKKLGLK